MQCSWKYLLTRVNLKWQSYLLVNRVIHHIHAPFQSSLKKVQQKSLNCCPSKTFENNDTSWPLSILEQVLVEKEAFLSSSYTFLEKISMFHPVWNKAEALNQNRSLGYSSSLEAKHLRWCMWQNRIGSHAMWINTYDILNHLRDQYMHALSIHMITINQTVWL